MHRLPDNVQPFNLDARISGGTVMGVIFPTDVDSISFDKDGKAMSVIEFLLQRMIPSNATDDILRLVQLYKTMMKDHYMKHWKTVDGVYTRSSTAFIILGSIRVSTMRTKLEALGPPGHLDSGGVNQHWWAMLSDYLARDEG